MTMLAAALPSSEILTAAYAFRETMALVKDGVARYHEYQNFRAKLENQRLLVESYFDHRFTERRHTLDGYFHNLEIAVTSQDHQSVSSLVNGIIALVEDNPLYDFEHFKTALADPNTVIEL